MPLTLVAIADTHGLEQEIEVPAGDILVHGGDITRHGELEDVRRFDDWLATLPHRHKIVIAGNHDFCFEREPERARALIRNGVYLQDEATEVEGLLVYGSPWQPWFYDWAFNLERGEPLRQRWARIPDETHLLVTHGPPMGLCDQTVRGDHVGCEDLLERVRAVRPLVHVFGHIHEAYGGTVEGQTAFVNASTCDLGYSPVNPPMVLEIDRR